MDVIVYLLIAFFTSILFYQFYLVILMTKTMVEGMDNNTTSSQNGQSSYQSYDTNDPNNALILAQKNAGNIEYLKELIHTVQGENLQQSIEDLSGNVQNLQTQVNGIIQSQQQYTNQMTNGKPVQITGTGVNDDNETTNE